jgi:deoxyhypusine synthase
VISLSKGERRLKKKREKYLHTPVLQPSVRDLKGIGDYIHAFSNMSFQARALGEGAKTLLEMVKSPNCLKTLTIAGAPVPGGLQGVICDLIELRFIDVVITTGSQIAHDLIEALGFSHHKGHHMMDDVELRDLRIDRMYDALLDETKLNEVDLVLNKLWEKLGKGIFSTPELFIKVVDYIVETGLHKGQSFLVSAAKSGIPVFSPTIHDSEIGISLTTFNKRNPQKRVIVDLLLDNEKYIEIFSDRKYKKHGVLILGGGVPRNWAQQVTPMIEFIKHGVEILEDREIGCDYGVLITTDQPQFGGLSGSTLDEAISWNKYAPQAKFATIHCDMTIALPLMVGAIREWMGV